MTSKNHVPRESFGTILVGECRWNFDSTLFKLQQKNLSWWVSSVFHLNDLKPKRHKDSKDPKDLKDLNTQKIQKA